MIHVKKPEDYNDILLKDFKKLMNWDQEKRSLLNRKPIILPVERQGDKLYW